MAVPEQTDRLNTALAGRYVIVRELGAGGMATVYLARDLKHEREVAIKVLRPDLSASLGAERFLREIRIAAQLQHPHVLTVFDSGEAGEFLYYVMPYIEGETLRTKLVRDGQLPVGDAVRILREIADALAYAHGRGVVHRDMKPENVMLSGRHASVMDFGVAKAVSEATGRQNLTTMGVALGTPTYMAPEQATADPHTDHRADIYAMGVIAYELLTGRPPFSGASPQQVLAAHVTQAPSPITQARATVPPALAELVMRCLEKNPSDRPQKASELFDRFDQLMTTSGSMTPTETAPHASVAAIAAGAKQRRGLRPIAIGLLALLAIGAGGWGVWRVRGGGAPGGPTRLAVVPFENQGPAAQSYFTDGLVDEVRTRLTELSSLRVIARTSSETYRGKKSRPQDMGSELGVQYVLTGTVRWQEGGAGGTPVKVRVSPELIRTSDGTTAWEKSFEVDPADAFAVQGRIANEVSEALHVALTPQEKSAANVGMTTNPAAYDAFLQAEVAAKHDVTAYTFGSPVSRAAYQRAIQLDPAFALAWAHLSFVRMEAYHFVLGGNDSLLVLAAAAAAESNRLAPGLAAAHIALGTVQYWGKRDYAAARREYEQAVAIAPNDGLALEMLGALSRREGRFDEALTLFRRVVELDPRNARALDLIAFGVDGTQGSAAAAPFFEHSVAIDPEFVLTWSDYFDSALGSGDTAAAQAVWKRADSALGTRWTTYILGDLIQNPNERMIGTVLDAPERTRLLAAVPSSGVDSIPLLYAKSVLVEAAGDAPAARRLADEAWEIAARRKPGIDGAQVRAMISLQRGRFEDAVRDAQSAVRQTPVSFDPVDGPAFLFILAEAHAAAGHTDSALVQVKALVTGPMAPGAASIERAPGFVTLRNDPRFKEIMKKARR